MSVLQFPGAVAELGTGLAQVEVQNLKRTRSRLASDFISSSV